MKKHCGIHGPLPPDKIYVRKTPLNKNKNGYSLECRYCRVISANKMNKVNAKYYKKRAVDLLLDYYVINRLSDDGFAKADISAGLIETKRAMIRLHRGIRQRSCHGQDQKKVDSS